MRLHLVDQLEGLAGPQGQNLVVSTLLARDVALLLAAADFEVKLDLLNPLLLLKNHLSLHEIGLGEH